MRVGHPDGTDVRDKGLVHGLLRARRVSKRAGQSLTAINAAIAALSRGAFPA